MVVGAAAAVVCYCSHSHSPFLLTRFRAVNVNANANGRDTQSESNWTRLQKLAQLDEELRRGDDKAALSLVRDLQGRGLHCFGAARQVPQRLYTLEDLKLNGIDTSSFLAPLDQTLASIDRTLQIALAFAAVSARFAFHLSQLQLLFIALALLFVWTLDQISFNGGVRNLLLDTIGHTFSHKYHNRVIQHEAGHFIIAYLLGVLPKSYTITSLETLTREGSLNVQAGTAFVDFEFLEEINSGKVSAKMLNRFSCIALAGVATEYLLYGYSEGGLGDIAKLDGLLKSLGFTQKKADSQVRWAVLNTILILRRHEKARLQLAVAMSDGKSVGSCIDVIESNIDFEDI
ncbi:hypothetical protein LUZ63_008636 [Rhynchospora breviuscula]|uniref:Stress regulated protein n=1 Tax=Rhynchospora breviuscula TaxID=2022672 RepID=A0A9Q0HVJ4_9POAL|nr:hypothetical protein LUZ63_008636 [Rhynchospora breviuscula]